MTTAPNLTLYGIETQLLELLTFRDSVLEDPDMTPAEQQESVKAIDQQIRDYVTAEVKKVDGIARYLREFETRAETLKEEAKRCNEAAKAWDKRHESLESMVIAIMREANKTRLDGRHSVLNLRKNPASVDVAQPELVPGEYRRIVVTMSLAFYERLRTALMMNEKLAPLGSELIQSKVSEPEAMRSQIGAELKLGGSVPGCRLKTDSVRLEVK
jgi:hypothetical protein